MKDKFGEWMLKFKETPEWKDDSFCWDDMAKSAFRFGLQTAAEFFELRARETEGRSPSRMILDRVKADIEKALVE